MKFGRGTAACFHYIYISYHMHSAPHRACQGHTGSSTESSGNPGDYRYRRHRGRCRPMKGDPTRRGRVGNSTTRSSSPLRQISSSHPLLSHFRPVHLIPNQSWLNKLHPPSRTSPCTSRSRPLTLQMSYMLQKAYDIVQLPPPSPCTLCSNPGFVAYNSTVKGPSELKLSITISPAKTVADLKAEIASKSEVEKERQRLIYSGTPYSSHPTHWAALSPRDTRARLMIQAKC